MYHASVNINFTSMFPASVKPVTEVVMSFELSQVFITVNFVFISGILCLFGIMANSVNMVVFYMQGFKITMTISFMALAISDMGCLITLEWYCIFLNPLWSVSKLDFVPREFNISIGAWPHITFARTTGWITTYITAERCLCITAPLAVRRIITPKRTTCILIFIFAVNFAVLLSQYATSHIGWKFYPEYNRSLVGLIVTRDNEKAETAAFFVHAILILGSFLCVTLLTVILVVKLRRASEWRNQATQSKAQTEDMSSKDKKATNMVVIISSLLIVLYTPSIILSLASFTEPQFGFYGAYKNLFFAFWSVATICNSLNSSVNIFMYYSMSTKYREVFNSTLLPTRKEK